jgi:signal transduction histidine kinase
MGADRGTNNILRCFVAVFLLRVIAAFSLSALPKIWGCPTKPQGSRWTTCLQAHGGWNDTRQESIPPINEPPPPIPVMPSQMFQRMAHSQLELLANSIVEPGKPASSKIESMALYLPQENIQTGQLEFVPVIIYPDPTTERVFIASKPGSGMALTLPRTLTKLPGFSHAISLLPGYPMISSSAVEPGVGVVEEVMCDVGSRNSAAALSVPLLSGSRTVGVLLVSPFVRSKKRESVWAKFDREQVSRAAQSLSMALSMDNERSVLQAQNQEFREGLSDSLHQVKNPLQALRTYGKLLQRQIANTQYQTDKDRRGVAPQLVDLVESLMAQSDRVVNLLVPMDSLVDSLESAPPPLYLNPARNDSAGTKSLVLWREQSLLPWENATIEFARDKATVTEFSSVTPVYQEQDFVTEQPPKEVPSSPRETASSTVVGDVHLEMTFVTDVLEPIFSAFKAIGSERGVKLEVFEETPDLPGVMAAPQSLQEAVSNVLDNAFKYVVLPKADSPLDSNIFPQVRVRLLANDKSLNPGVTIIVEDNGPGIQEQDRERIFERGFRSESTSSVAGTGIGLDICRTLVKRMGGFLTVASPKDFKDSLDGSIVKIILFRKPDV